MFIQALSNALFQVVLFSLIPLVWWAFTARKKENFFIWLGIKKPVVQDRKKWLFALLAVTAACWLLAQLAIWVRGPLAAADSQYKGMGAAAIPSVLVYAVIQTAMSEEILFRGFLMKRLISKFGFRRGNILQAVIFGLVHLLMVWGHANLLAGLMIVLYPMAAAVSLAYMNEKASGGSILPSWLIHSILNAVSGISAAI